MSEGLKDSLGRALSKQLVEDQVDRICASQGFRKSKQQIRFLQYCVAQTIEPSPNGLSEYSIAQQVFGKADFDPLDSCVRGGAHKLRNSLAKYYASDGGRSDPLRLEVSRGYVIIFTLQTEVCNSTPVEFGVDPQNPPYVGPKPFLPEDNPRFFGRTEESVTLADLIGSDPSKRVILLFSTSGAGKTSLLILGFGPN